MNLTPDDPKLTAYVLEELDPAEQAAVGATIQDSAPLYEETLQIYATARWLADELKDVPQPGLDADREAVVTEAIEQRAASGARAFAEADEVDAPPNVLPFAAWVWRWGLAATALAACLVLAFFSWQRWGRPQPNALVALAGRPEPPASTSPPPEPQPSNLDANSAADQSYQPSPQGSVTEPNAGIPAESSPPATNPPKPLNMDIRWMGPAPKGYENPPSNVPAQPPPPAANPPAQPRQDIRMMMRYGLVPKGFKLDRGSTPTQPPPSATAPYRQTPPTYDPSTRLWRYRAGNAVNDWPTLRYWHRPSTRAPGTESYAPIRENGFLDPLNEPLSTFGLDVDTASYALVRRFLNEGRWPPRDAVRIEEMINYFAYDYGAPRDDSPFAVNLEVAGCPWNAGHRLVRIGVKARELARADQPPCNLVFLVDVSGSMSPAKKLPLLKQGLRMLVERLRPQDTVAIVVYADNSRVVLPPTRGDRKEAIMAALDRLHASGTTNGGAGIQTAYDQARRHFNSEGVNRVILCTDGDFNVGLTDPLALQNLVQYKTRSGVFLSVLGFGVGNYKDSTMERLADRGNGNYAYVDTLNEAHKVLIEQMSGTLVTVAKDVKAQVEFNPAWVREYRLIGYEDRALAPQDFNNDRQDAGDLGAGHTVTMLYEIVPNADRSRRSDVDPLRYQPSPRRPSPSVASDELLTLKLRYKEPEGATSRLLEFPLKDSGRPYAQASADFKFASAVAAFGMILRDSPHRGSATLGGVLELAGEGIGPDPRGYRQDFLDLVRRAENLRPSRPPASDSHGSGGRFQ